VNPHHSPIGQKCQDIFNAAFCGISPQPTPPTPQGGGGAKGQEVAFPESRLDGSMSRDRAMAQSTWRATPKFSTCQDAHLNGVFLFVLLERLEELDHFGTGPLKSNTEVY